MANVPGKTTKVFLDGFDITGYANASGLEKKVAMVDSTVFSLNSERFFAGLKSGQIPFQGFYDDSDIVTAWPLENILGNAKVLSVIRDNAASKRGDGGNVRQVEYGIAEPVEGIVTVSALFKLNGPPYYAPVLEPKTTLSATGDSASRDDGALSSAGAVGILHVGGIVGASGTITAKIQDSVNGVAWADVPGLGFTNITSVNGGGEVKVTSATENIDRYLKAVFTLAGFTSFWVVVLCGRLL